MKEEQTLLVRTMRNFFKGETNGCANSFCPSLLLPVSIWIMDVMAGALAATGSQSDLTEQSQGLGMRAALAAGSPAGAWNPYTSSGYCSLDWDMWEKISSYLTLLSLCCSSQIQFLTDTANRPRYPDFSEPRGSSAGINTMWQTWDRGL